MLTFGKHSYTTNTTVIALYQKNRVTCTQTALLKINRRFTTCHYTHMYKTGVDLFDTHNYDGNLASNITHNINRGFSFWKKSFKEKKYTKRKSSDERNSAPSILYYSGEKRFISDSDSPTASLVVFPVF